MNRRRRHRRLTHRPGGACERCLNTAALTTHLGDINTFMTNLRFDLPVTGNAIDALPVSAQWWQVEIHSVCRTASGKGKRA